MNASTLRCCAVFALLVTCARAVTLTATFDGLVFVPLSGETVASPYQEGGLTFTNSSGPLGIMNAGSWVFPSTQGVAIRGSTVSVSAGALMTDASVAVLSNWNTTLISAGLINPYFLWETFSSGQQTGQGTVGPHLNAANLLVSDPNGFDVLRVSSWSQESGQGPIALGSITANTFSANVLLSPIVSAPDTGSTAVLLLLGVVSLAVHRRRNRSLPTV